MKFVQLPDIKEGMRIAKPVYNKKGVLLYGRGTEVRGSVLANLETLNLFGLYILEPAEPLPPISDDELEFERFQVVAGYMLTDELQKVVNGEFTSALDSLAADIVDRYGTDTKKISFIQSIRNPDDHVYKHSINVAILTALISKQLDIPKPEQHYMVVAGLLHDIGKLLAPPEILNKSSSLTSTELNTIRNAELRGYDLIRENYMIPAGIRRFFSQMHRELSDKMSLREGPSQKLLLGTKIIKLADMYDILTAMRIYKDPMSEFSAVTFMLNNDRDFDEALVEALMKSIYILPVGACVELTNGEKGLVLSDNEYYPLRPSVLSFGSNNIYDLGLRRIYEQVQIKDIMKTMDNRFVISQKP